MGWPRSAHLIFHRNACFSGGVTFEGQRHLSLWHTRGQPAGAAAESSTVSTTPSGHPPRSRDLGRRAFLKLTAASAAAVGLHPLVGRRGTARASARRVSVEDLALGPADFGRGAFDGTTSTDSGIEVARGRGRGRYVSPVLDASRAFTHVGLHWSVVDIASGPAFEVRTNSGPSWSAWEPVLVEAHRRDGAGETFGALISVDRGTRVQFRTALSAGDLLQTVTVTLLNAVDGPEVSARASRGSWFASVASADTTPPPGTAYTRQEWGADESVRFSGDDEIWDRMYVPVKKVVVHHTATSNDYSTAAAAMAEVRAIYTYHAVTLGWGDIGYNTLIDKWGNVYEGRHGRGNGATREQWSPMVTAGHASSHNYGSTGVALLGTFTKQGEGGKPQSPPPASMQQSLVDVVAWECDRHHIDARTSSDFLLFDESWNHSLQNISGHRDCVSTVCPGGHVYDLLPWLRDQVASSLGRSASALSKPSADTATLDEARDLTFSWGDADAQIVLEGWSRNAATSDDPYAEHITYLAGFDSTRYPTWESAGMTSATFGALVERFGIGDAGHYTFHVRSGTGYQADHTLLITEGGSGGDNAAPSVEITAPADGATFAAGTAVEFSGAASDAEDGDLTASLEWSSSLDGPLGTGGTAVATLSEGTHSITASVTDADGATGSASITVVIEGESEEQTGDLVLDVTGHKDRGLQKTDLAWTGGTADGSIEVKRDDVLIATVPNTGAYTDHINNRGGGSYLYQVCDLATGTCSSEVPIIF